MMSKHILWSADEVVERITADFDAGMTALDELEALIREEFDGLEALKLADHGRVASS